MLGISTCWSQELCHARVCHIPIHFSLLQGRCEPCWAGVANVVWGYWLGEKNIFVLPYATPRHPPCTLLLLFCKHHHCSRSKLSFQAHFQLFFRMGFKRWSRWSNAKPKQPRLWGGCRNPGMEPGLLGSLLNPKACRDSPSTLHQALLMELHLISSSTSFCCSLSWQLERVLIKGLTHSLSQLIIFFLAGC